MANKFSSGRLRHRIDLELKVEEQDSSGDMVETWNLVKAALACEIAPLSAREYLAAQALQSGVTTKLTIRWRMGINAKMRAVHRYKGVTTYYNIAGILPDPDSGLEWMTLPVSSGVNDG
jgi:SPP1 family predicted phage head-tail adaptor